MPAFAYGFMLLLMAYPTYRWLGGGASGSLVIASQAVYVRAWTDGELRGGDEGIEIPELILEPTTRIVEVTVWVPASLAKEAGYALARVSLSDQRGRRWREEHPPSLVSIEGRSAFHFTLDRANIEPGLISIRIEREERGTTDARVLAEAQFRIRENP
jgi:hypothetical protein